MKKRNRKWDEKFSRIGLGLTLLGITAVFVTLLSPYIGAGGGTVALTGQVTATTTCTFTTSNAAINFGSITVGTNTIGTSGAYNVITVTNSGSSTTGSNILLSGSNWNYNSNTFKVTNTIWSAVASNNLWNPQASSSTTGTANVEVTLTGSSVDSLQNIVAGNTNTIWFGVNVPTTAVGAVYSQTINVISSC